MADAREHVVKFRIGRIVDSDYQPGLHFKIPFFENVARYPNRILNYDEESQERFLTGEKKNLIVDYFVTWRIVDIYERETRKGGSMVFIISEGRYSNQRGELLAINRETMIR